MQPCSPFGLRFFLEEPPSGLSPQKSAGARTAGPEVTEEITEIEISLEDETG